MNVKELVESVKVHECSLSFSLPKIQVVEKSELDRVVEELHNINVVYAFRYCSSCWESVPFTMSLHRTRKGAEMAMEFHKHKVKSEFEELWGKDAVMPMSEAGWDHDQLWDIATLKIED
jgi:hypothetical protein